MDKHIIKILNKIVKAKGMKIVKNEDCEFRAEKGWGSNKEVIDIYFYRYEDETYDITLDKLVDENVEIQDMKTTRIEEDNISERRLINLLNELM